MKIQYRCTCGKIVRPKIVPAKKEHVATYMDFANAIGEGVADLPVYGVKRRRPPMVTMVEREWFTPSVRGATKQALIPEPKQRPCDVCSHAQYNTKCVNEENCVAILYWTLTKVQDAVDAGFHKTLETLIKTTEETKPCGVTPVKHSSPSPGSTQSASSAGKISGFPLQTCSTKAPARSSKKHAPRK